MSEIAMDELSAYWGKPGEALLKQLQSSARGLSSAEASARLQKVGPNSLRKRQARSPARLFPRQFASPIGIILLVATLLSAFLQDWADAIIILVIVFGSAILSFTQEYNAHNAADKLLQQLMIKSDVVRDRREQSIPAEQVVAGDAIHSCLPFLHSQPSRTMLLVILAVGDRICFTFYTPGWQPGHFTSQPADPWNDCRNHCFIFHLRRAGKTLVLSTLQ